MTGRSDTTDGTRERVLEVQGLVSGHGGIPVLRGVDLHVEAGEVVALLGPNGAGKTTTLLTVSAMLPILGGAVEVLGAALPHRRRVRPGDAARLARRRVAHVPEDRGVFFDLTAEENLRLGRPRGRCVPEPLPLEQILGWFPALRDVLQRRAGLLSGGEQQMLALARAMSRRPRLLMVDEMSLGLAPAVVDHLLPLLRTIASELGAGVLLVEQHVTLALEVSDRAYLMDRGRIATSGAADEMARRTGLFESGYLGDITDAGS